MGHLLKLIGKAIRYRLHALKYRVKTKRVIVSEDGKRSYPPGTIGYIRLVDRGYITIAIGSDTVLSRYDWFDDSYTRVTPSVSKGYELIGNSWD